MTTSRPPTSPGYRDTPAWRAYDAVAQAVDQRIGWDKLPWPLGLAVLVGVRNVLRQRNLHDTTALPTTGEAPLPPPDSVYLTTRTPDGTYNDLSRPAMGRAGSRFGRNVPLEATHQESPADLMTPNPRTVSRELMTRREFQPVPHLNALTAAWLQFMIRDWFSHGKHEKEDFAGDGPPSTSTRGNTGHPWPAGRGSMRRSSLPARRADHRGRRRTRALSGRKSRHVIRQHAALRRRCRCVRR